MHGTVPIARNKLEIHFTSCKNETRDPSLTFRSHRAPQDAYSAAGALQDYVTFELIDFPLMIVSAVFLTGAVSSAVHWALGPEAGRRWLWLNLLPVGAMMCDAVENLSILFTLSDYPNNVSLWWISVAATANVTKWLLSYAAFSVLSVMVTLIMMNAAAALMINDQRLPVPAAGGAISSDEPAPAVLAPSGEETAAAVSETTAPVKKRAGTNVSVVSPGTHGNMTVEEVAGAAAAAGEFALHAADQKVPAFDKKMA